MGVPINLTVRGDEIATLLDRVPAGVSVLSLDCFDTLIWRNTQAPADVFAEIALEGGGVELRSGAEAATRRTTFNRTGGHEIALDDVYRWLHPTADDAARAEAIAHELRAEARHAFAFAPVVALIREAKRRGLTVVIVSDMYMTEAQLRAHIAAAAGDEVIAMIDRVFVSADRGKGKQHGLFDVVVATLGVAAEAIVHLGDNHESDYLSAARHGIHAVHFRQFDAETQARLRMEALAATMIDPAIRIARPVCQAHRARIALRASDDPAVVLGHDVLGPVLRCFALWLKDEVDALADRLGRPVRPLFMMRDGYMLYRAFDALFPDYGGRPVEISRFVATRASLSDAAALDRFLAEKLDTLPIRLLARHLMLYENEVATFLKKDEDEATRAAFVRMVRRPDTQRKILTRAAAFADKMMNHLHGQDVRPGDAVMLVDIGYNGSVQNIIDPVLRGRMGLTVAGRYLIMRETQISGLDKRGLLDTRHYERRVLHGMTSCIAAIEQLCNVEQGSTIDYRADGSPVREAPDMKAAQNAARHVVQAAALDYVRSADAGVHRPPASDDADTRREAAAAIIARLFFMPNAREVALYETFDHDPNLGSNKTMRLLDADDAREGLRRRGLAYVNERWRTYVPGELHRQGLPMSLSMFATSRYGLDLRTSDFEVGGVAIPVMMMTAEGQAVVDITAHPTADGFYRMRVPVGPARPVLGIQLGRQCAFVQIDELLFTRLSDVDSVRSGKRTIAAAPVMDGLQRVGPDLYEASERGFVMVPPPLPMDEPAVLSLVFRPIVWRGQAAHTAAAA